MTEILIGGATAIIGFFQYLIYRGTQNAKRDEALLKDYEETKSELSETKKSLNDSVLQNKNLEAKFDRFQKDYLKLQDDVAILKSDKKTDRDTIRNLNAQVEDIPALRQEIRDLREEMNATNKSKEELAKALSKSQEKCQETEQELRELKARYDEATKQRLDAQNVIEAMTLIARQSNESAPKTEAQEGAESKDAVTPDQ